MYHHFGLTYNLFDRNRFENERSINVIHVNRTLRIIDILVLRSFTRAWNNHKYMHIQK